jgi:hypothetical protein
MMTRDNGEPMGYTINLFIESLKLKYEVVRTWWKSLKISSLKCCPSRTIVLFIGTLVKRDTSKLTIS